MSAVAELVLRNGEIVTVDRHFSIAEAVAIAQGKFLHVGSSGEMDPYIGPDTRVIDLVGKCVIPGLIDTHAHMDREGLKELFPALTAAQSVQEVVQIIAREVPAKQPGEWLVTAPLGTPPFFFDAPTMLAENRIPTRWDLDAVSPQNPVYIQAIWVYWDWPPLVSVLNSRALELCGISSCHVHRKASLSYSCNPSSRWISPSTKARPLTMVMGSEGATPSAVSR